jgi:hypothetical protein
MGMKFVNMQDVEEAVDNSTAYLDSKYGKVTTWRQEQERWYTEFRVTLIRTDSGDYIMFPDEEDHAWWISKWT